jgi:hypothetical protein
MGGKAKILRTMGLAVLGAFMLVAWSTGSALAYMDIQGDCLACHSLGNVIVPDPNAQFALGTPWHDFHGAIADCALCHPAGPGSPVPTRACLECHPDCTMMDPHSFDPWYKAHVKPEPPCWVCHPNCLEPGICGNGVIEWRLGETCDPPGSQCGRTAKWVCNDNCQCVRKKGECGDGIVEWKAGENCEPGVGNECGPNKVCVNCRCVEEPLIRECPGTDNCDDGILDFCPDSGCQCHPLAEGGGLCIDSQPCAGQEPCTNSGECPPGELCFVNTCCGPGGLCLDVVCSDNPPLAADDGAGMSGGM